MKIRIPADLATLNLNYCILNQKYLKPNHKQFFTISQKRYYKVQTKFLIIIVLVLRLLLLMMHSHKLLNETNCKNPLNKERPLLRKNCYKKFAKAIFFLFVSYCSSKSALIKIISFHGDYIKELEMVVIFWYMSHF
jgi:hypothetical protein